MSRAALSYLLLLLVAYLDYATGHEVRLGTLYLLVVAIASWNLRPSRLVLYTLATVLLWSGVEQLSGFHYSRAWLTWWNALNRLGAVTITAFLVSRAKITLDHQQHLIRELGQALLKLNQYKELVPICRLCHKVHLDDDYQTRLDGMIEEGTNLESAGTICPTCSEERATRVASIPVGKYFSSESLS